MSAGRRRFRIIKEIAEGGFGKVYLAEQISSDGFSRIVAVKLLHAKWSSHDEVVMRTRDEARLLGLIRHQHIVKVEDLTSIDGKCAIVMEYLEGCDLKWMISFLQERGLDFPRAALFEIVLAVASALDAAYNGVPLQGGQPLRVIHRDIKPSNIFVTVAGGVKVLDFGTARANFAEREAKTQALAFGSQGYMAPERMLGEEDTPAADVFSLGIALYEILSLESFGRIPPRPNKFATKVEERVRSLPLSGDPEWCDQVRDTLRLMLSYEASERPTAAQLVEIMELLAQDANDMGLRRFCRTLVAEAKANLPDLDTGDPLTGRIVEEDKSASFSGSKNMSTTFVDEEDDLAAPPTERMKASDIARITNENFGESEDGNTPTMRMPVDPSLVKNKPKQAAAKAVPAVQAPAPPDEGGGGGGLVALLFGGSFAALVLVGVVAVLLILLVVGIYFMNQPTVGTSTPTPKPTPLQPIPTPKPEPMEPLVIEKANDGGAKVTLQYPDPAGAEIIIKGPQSFSAKWDGKEPAELDLKDGRYRTVVKAGDDTFRPTLTVDPKKKKCSFSFDVGTGEWTGGCN
ncbi:MAG: serine/threonine protein kinase [Alphaproteobacteria bacterium]|nr:serine/threonine protein kinase [Alphaproteobacteria bacterium]